jgi:hypothetical protein
MSEQETPETESNPQGWDDVLEQFKAFGESLGRAIEGSWNDPRTQDVVSQIKDGLRQAADEIDGAIDRARHDPGLNDFVEDARDAFRDLEETGKEAVEKARPHVVKAMRSLNEALNNAIRGMDSKENDQPE